MRRIPPIPAKEWPRELFEAGRALVPPDGHPNAAMAADRPKGVATMETFAHHPDLVRAFFPFNGHVLYGTTLTPRLRQFLIMRVAARRRAAYLWAQHVFSAREIGLTDEELARIAFGPSAPFLEPLDAAALCAVDELIDEGVISDSTWRELASELDERQLLDVIFTVGCYQTIASFMRSVDLEVDPSIGDLL
jgi:alkylhydroperoxidase family enzyme